MSIGPTRNIPISSFFCISFIRTLNTFVLHILQHSNLCSCLKNISWSGNIKKIPWSSNASDLYFADAQFKSWPWHWLFWQKKIHDFPQSFQANTVKPLFIVFVGGLEKKQWIRENSRCGSHSWNRIRSGTIEIERRIWENELSGNDR
jgi:hypothetical protein